MKVALYFGSFNPIHIGHLIIANHIVNMKDYKKVWFVVSPQNPLKESKNLLNEYNRLHLVRLAIEEDPNFRVCDIEFKLPKPSYTIDTLTHLRINFPTHQFAVVMGSDSFQNFNKWKNYKKLIAENEVIIFKRPGFEVKQTLENQVILEETPLLEISASNIRKLIQEGKSIRYLVPDKVREEIEKGRYYKI